MRARGKVIEDACKVLIRIRAERVHVALSPKTNLVILATLIGLILISLFYSVGIQSRGFLVARIAVVVAIILYVLLTRIARPKNQI